MSLLVRARTTTRCCRAVPRPDRRTRRRSSRPRPSVQRSSRNAASTRMPTGLKRPTVSTRRRRTSGASGSSSSARKRDGIRMRTACARRSSQDSDTSADGARVSSGPGANTDPSRNPTAGRGATRRPPGDPGVGPSEACASCTKKAKRVRPTETPGIGRLSPACGKTKSESSAPSGNETAKLAARGASASSAKT